MECGGASAVSFKSAAMISPAKSISPADQRAGCGAGWCRGALTMVSITHADQRSAGSAKRSRPVVPLGRLQRSRPLESRHLAVVTPLARLRGRGVDRNGTRDAAASARNRITATSPLVSFPKGLPNGMVGEPI